MNAVAQLTYVYNIIVIAEARGELEQWIDAHWNPTGTHTHTSG
jgi:hypothetical protein